MDVRQLSALVAIADHGTFSAAARALFTVQSNVSSHIARLERELGTTLVDRAHGGLTDDGQRVVERARRILREMDEIAVRRGDRRRPGQRRRPHRDPRHDGAVAAPPPARRPRRAPPERARDRLRGQHVGADPEPARRPLQRRHHPPPRRRPRARRSSRCSPRTSSSSPTASTRWPAAASCRWPRSPPTGCCCRRPARRCAGCSTGPPARSACSCGPRPRSTASACSPAWPPTATARRSSRRRRCSPYATGRFAVVRVPELPPRVVALAYQRRPAPGAPTRALFDVLRDVDLGRRQPAGRPGRLGRLPARAAPSDAA